MKEGKNFTLLLSFHLMILFANEIIRFSLPIWIFQQESNLISFSIASLFGLLPRIFSPFLGGLVDAFNKKKLLLLSTLSLGLTSTLIALFQNDWLLGNLTLICPLIFLLGLLSNLIQITNTSLIPQTARKENLLKANSLMIAAESSTNLLCPMIAGALITYVTSTSILLITTLTFLLSMFFLKVIKIPEMVKASKTEQLLKIINSLSIGASFIKKDSRLAFMLTLSCLVNFFFSLCFTVLTPMIMHSYPNDALILGSILSIGCGAQILLTLFAGHFLKNACPVNLLIKSIIGLGLFGPIIIGLKLSPVFWTIGCATTLALASLINCSNQTFWQRNSPVDLQGTLFGIRRSISSSIAPFGALLSGPFVLVCANQLNSIERGYQIVFILSGICILFVGIFGYLFAKSKANTASNMS